MTLGEWIDTLTMLHHDAEVVMDCGTVPVGLASWRGVYAELTLDSRTDAEAITVKELLRDATEAVGTTFQGYKGGAFTMDRSTPVWADEWGEYRGRMLLGVVASGDKIVLKTMVRPEEYA